MKHERGFALASGIFLLVIIALLGAFMVSFSTTGNVDSANDLQGSRGYRAARMGAEWAVASICANAGASVGCSTPLPDCPTIPSTLLVTQDGFTVTVTCEAHHYNEARTLVNGEPKLRDIFWITSTATTGGSPGNLGYIERSINAFVEFPN